VLRTLFIVILYFEGSTYSQLFNIIEAVGMFNAPSQRCVSGNTLMKEAGSKQTLNLKHMILEELETEAIKFDCSSTSLVKAHSYRDALTRSNRWCVQKDLRMNTCFIESLISGDVSLV